MTKGEFKVWTDLEEVELLKEFGENPSRIAAEAINARAAFYSDTARQERILKCRREIERLERLEVKSARREVVQEEAERNWLNFVRDFEEIARKPDFEPRMFSFWYNAHAKDNGFAKRRDELLPIYAKYHPKDAERHFHYSCEQPNKSAVYSLQSTNLKTEDRRPKTEMVEPGAGNIPASKAERPAVAGG